jgi:hypothetical protein
VGISELERQLEANGNRELELAIDWRRKALSILWIALEWVEDREPNILPWKALPKERIERSGEPAVI